MSGCKTSPEKTQEEPLLGVTGGGGGGLGCDNDNDSSGQDHKWESGISSHPPGGVDIS